MRHMNPHSPEAVETTAGVIESFVRERFQIPPSDDLFSRQVNLWEEGYVDSLGVVEVIEFLERRFAVKLPEEVIFDPDFTSIDGIARHVVGLKSAP
jgi:acyl carrier protein